MLHGSVRCSLVMCPRTLAPVLLGRAVPSIQVQGHAFVEKEVNRTHRHVALKPSLAQ